MARKKASTKPRKSEQQLAIEAEYKAVRERFTSNIRSAKKRGYIFPENYVPSIPKNITEQSINRLHKLNAQRYEKAQYKTASGEIVSGKAGQAIRRREGGKKQSETKRAKYYNRRNIILSEEGIYVDTITGEEYGELDTIKETPEGTLVDVKTGKTVGTYGDEGEGGLFDETIIDNFLDEMSRAGDAFGQVFNDFIEWSKSEYGEHATSRMIQQAAYAGDLPTHSQRYALESSISFIDTFTNKYLSNDTLWGARADFASHIRALGKYNEYNQMFDQQRANYRNERRAARNARRRNK